ncbi:hypothetical protein BDY21DRAFT_168392 [Lineolata rhizophorae]|uniref:Uncharacterized protein n=1 Tax=Lineolata rhizophorae TaxID=578093 RepID=A0A6A6P9M6_9PEZI|nr:hypothetical protein BDY21DRAFT_168392 [Lineolata rhizophorae]
MKKAYLYQGWRYPDTDPRWVCLHTRTGKAPFAHARRALSIGAPSRARKRRTVSFAYGFCAPRPTVKQRTSCIAPLRRVFYVRTYLGNSPGLHGIRAMCSGGFAADGRARGLAGLQRRPRERVPADTSNFVHYMPPEDSLVPAGRPSTHIGSKFCRPGLCATRLHKPEGGTKHHTDSHEDVTACTRADTVLSFASGSVSAAFAVEFPDLLGKRPGDTRACGAPLAYFHLLCNGRPVDLERRHGCFAVENLVESLVPRRTTPKLYNYLGKQRMSVRVSATQTKPLVRLLGFVRVIHLSV